MAGFNLATVAVAATTFIHWKGPDGELLYAVAGEDSDPGQVVKKAVGGLYYTPGSKEYQKAVTKRSNRFTERLKKRKTDQSTDERLDEQAQFYADITAELQNVEYAPAAGLTGAAFAKAIYAEPALFFLIPQIEEELGDTENFMQPSPKN
jgi:hypothetical protein